MEFLNGKNWTSYSIVRYFSGQNFDICRFCTVFMDFKE